MPVAFSAGRDRHLSTRTRHQRIKSSASCDAPASWWTCSVWPQTVPYRRPTISCQLSCTCLFAPIPPVSSPLYSTSTISTALDSWERKITGGPNSRPPSSTSKNMDYSDGGQALINFGWFGGVLFFALYAGSLFCRLFVAFLFLTIFFDILLIICAVIFGAPVFSSSIRVVIFSVPSPSLYGGIARLWVCNYSSPL